MNILLLHYAAPPVVGGVETVMARQAQLFADAGHHVQILTGRGQTWDERIPVVVNPRFDSRFEDVLEFKTPLDRGIVPAGFDNLVKQIEQDLSPALRTADVVILHNVASLHKNLALTAALYNLSQQAGSPRFILWHHDLAWTTDRYLSELHPGWPWDLLRQDWPGAKQVVVSQVRRHELASLTGIREDEIEVIPAGLNLGEFLGFHESTRLLVGGIDLTTAAPILLAPVRITRRKNLELAIATVAALKKELPEASLIITGPPGAHNPANLAYLAELHELRTKRLQIYIALQMGCFFRVVKKGLASLS